MVGDEIDWGIIANFAADLKKERERDERDALRRVRCPDCGADLRIESKDDLPLDTKLVFVKHNI